jgi:Fe/S biogenesis protein NfuA
MPPNTVFPDDRIYDAVDEIFRDEINPMVARHGGKVELVDVQDATVVVRLMGGCQGCGMATVTLRQGIETALRQALPGIRAIKDITDHGSGKNPYYAPGTAGKSAVG